MNDGLRLSTALFLSLLLHMFLLAVLSTAAVLRDMRFEPPSLLDVDVVSLPPPAAKAPEPPTEAEVPAPEPAPDLSLPEYQIVAPPEGGQAKAPARTRLLSDRDVTVKEEMVRRGEPLPGDDAADESAEAAKPEPQEAAKSAAAARAEKPRALPPPDALAALPKMDQLLPSASQLAREGYRAQESAEAGGSQTARAGNRKDLLKYGDAWHSASRRPGTLDFLPDVREGDITLLNTKAEMFAPFVRRVAVRVFGHLVILLRRELAGVAAAARESVTVEAVMNDHGELVSLEVKDRSAGASLGTDRALQRACYEGFFDRNPPSGAEAEDGNIHFLLNTQVVVIGGPEGRPIGYQGVFSVGLL